MVAVALLGGAAGTWPATECCRADSHLNGIEGVFCECAVANGIRQPDAVCTLQAARRAI